MKREELPTPVANHQKASAAVSAALGMLEYPATKAEVMRKVGDWGIPVAGDLKLPLKQMLKAIPEERFQDVSEAQGAIDRHWGAIQANLKAIEKAQKKRAKK